MLISHQGPIEEYLKVASKTLDVFNNDLRRGDPTAASIFAAEAICRSLADLTQTIENQSHNTK